MRWHESCSVCVCVCDCSWLTLGVDPGFWVLVGLGGVVSAWVGFGGLRGAGGLVAWFGACAAGFGRGFLSWEGGGL